MSENPNEITIENSVLILIDHQPWVEFAVKSIDGALLVNNVVSLATAAKTLDVPVILTTVGASGGLLKDPLMGEIAKVFPDEEPIDRVSTNAWADIKPAVEATGRKVLLLSGLWTEVCVAETALSAIKDGYTVYFISDCCGGVSQEAHEDGKRRMVSAGANGLNWISVICEWAPEYTSPERLSLVDLFLERGGTVGLSLEYMVANAPEGAAV